MVRMRDMPFRFLVRQMVWCVVGMPLLMSTGCSKESKEVCDHLRELAADLEHYETRNKDHARCVKEVNAYLKEDPERFRSVEACILDAETFAQAEGCALEI